MCLQNAEELIQEATLLRQNGKYARAVALSIIALEELGKRDTLWRVLNFGDNHEEWREFWRTFRSHQAKIENMLFDNYAIAPEPEAFEEVQKMAQQSGAFLATREASLYVDIINGEPHLPSSNLTERMSDVVLRSAGAHLAIHKTLKPTAEGMAFAEASGNRLPGESRLEWVKRALGGEVPPHLIKMIEAFDANDR